MDHSKLTEDLKDLARASIIFRIAPRSKLVSLVRFASELDQVLEIMHSFILFYANRLFSLVYYTLPTHDPLPEDTSNYHNPHVERLLRVRVEGSPRSGYIFYITPCAPIRVLEPSGSVHANAVMRL